MIGKPRGIKDQVPRNGTPNNLPCPMFCTALPPRVSYLNLLVLEYLRIARFTYIEQFSLERKDAVPIAPYDTEARDCKGLGRVSFREDQSTILA